MMPLETSEDPAALGSKREAELHDLCMNSVGEKPPQTAVIHVHNSFDSPYDKVMEQSLENQASAEANKSNGTTTKSAIDTTSTAGMEPTPCFMKFRIGFAAVGVFVGLSILVCFQADPNLRNLHIALWGLASACFALMTLIVHYAHLKLNRDRWVHRLKGAILLGFIVQAGCVVAFFTYIILAAVQKQPLMPLNSNDQGYYVAAVWVWMTWKWSFALFWYSRAYRKVYITRYETIP